MKISMRQIFGWLLLLLLTAFFLWGYSKIEYVEEKISGDFQGAAARNPLLAVGRLAEHYGATAHFVPAYSKPPPSGATLVFSASRYWFTPEQNNALLDWVRTEGGHLIVTPQSQRHRGKRMGHIINDTPGDPLLASLGISLESLTGYPTMPDEDSYEPDQDNTFPYFSRQFGEQTKLETQTIELPDGTRLKARFDPQWRLTGPGGNSGWRISGSGERQSGDYAISHTLGKGRVTVLANLDFVKNHMIGEDDHAALFVYLVSLAKGQDIWFAYGANVPALGRWLVGYAWTVLVAAALLLITWLWSISRRFGPLLPARSRARRSITEHVAASARYLWRGNQGQALYRTLCNDFYQRAYLRHPHWSQLPVQELNQEIALFVNETQIPQLSGLTEQAVGHLLDTTRPRDKNQFAADSHLLDILRNRL